MRAALCPLGIALAVSLALAECVVADDAYPAISLKEIKSGGFQPGQKARITGKYEELLINEIKLHGVPLQIRISPQQTRELLAFKARKDNLTIDGHFAEVANSGEEAQLPVFEIDALHPAPSDEEIWGERLRAILAGAPSESEAPGQEKAPDRGSFPTAIEEFWHQVVAHVRDFPDPAVQAIARKASIEHFKARTRGMDGQDATGRVAVIRDLFAQSGDRDFAIELLRAEIERSPEHAATQRFLGELGCRPADGRWLAYDEFKRRQGFVLHQAQWVKPERKLLREMATALQKESQPNLILRSKTDREYLILAQAGKVEGGMTREELAQTKGLPDRVIREAWDKSELDLWIYEDVNVVVFNGQVLKTQAR